ncbi:Ig-like domain-containing protein, partial [Myxococcota bacterium]|nr:Ig-like domain-containing protein [Myxococcota bacterium]
ATAVYADGSTVDVTTSVSWASSNTSVATIANAPPSSGVAVAIGAGVTSITATDRATGLVGSVSLIVTEARLATLEITPRTATIAVGARTNLIATGLYTSGATIDVTRRVTWTSSDPAVATVDTRGQVTPLRAGLTTISARDATSGLDTTTLGTSARITVTPATVTSVAVLPLSATLAVGDTLLLQGLALYTDQTSRDCTATGAWSSSAPAIASVDATGLVTALSAGTVTISIVDDVSGVASGARSAQLVVAPPALRALAVTPPTSAIVTGYTRQLVAVGTFSDGSSAPVIATRVMWRSSATSVATVSTSATSALISVSNANLLSLAIVPTSTTIPAGADLALVALGSYDDGSTEDLTNVVTWASSTSTVARVSNTAGERGRVTAVGAGSTLVTVTDTTTGITSLPGSSAWISVDPTVTLSSVVVTPRTASIVGGQTIRFAAEATFSDGARHAVSDGVAWSSSSPLVASISSSASTAGVATGLTDGTTVISALHTPTGVASGAASATLTVLRPTLQDFDGATGAPYTLAHHLGLFSAQVLAGGPTGSFLRLAQDGTTDTVNSIAFPRSGVGAAPVRVVLDFDFRFAGSGCSADGFGVLYLPTSMHGTSGPAPQFDEEPELPQAIGVGLDLYDNAPELFGGNQVSLHWNGALISEQDGIIPMANGQFHHARITLRANGATTLVDVVLSVPGGSATPVVTGTAIPAALYEGRFAIAARTGGCTAHHDIDNVAVRHE